MGHEQVQYSWFNHQGNFTVPTNTSTEVTASQCSGSPEPSATKNKIYPQESATYELTFLPTTVPAGSSKSPGPTLHTSGHRCLESSGMQGQEIMLNKSKFF